MLVLNKLEDEFKYALALLLLNLQNGHAYRPVGISIEQQPGVTR